MKATCYRRAGFGGGDRSKVAFGAPPEGDAR